MARVKRGVQTHARHKKVLKEAKGYYGARRKVYRVAKQAVTKAAQYSYRDRRQRKRQFRCGSFVSMPRRVNAACPIAGSWMASTKRTSRSTARSWRTWRCMIALLLVHWRKKPRPAWVKQSVPEIFRIVTGPWRAYSASAG